jgi:hypothetical protein
MHTQLSWLKDYGESKQWLEALKVYRTVEGAVTCHLQQVCRHQAQNERQTQTYLPLGISKSIDRPIISDP